LCSAFIHSYSLLKSKEENCVSDERNTADCQSALIQPAHTANYFCVVSNDKPHRATGTGVYVQNHHPKSISTPPKETALQIFEDTAPISDKHSSTSNPTHKREKIILNTQAAGLVVLRL